MRKNLLCVMLLLTSAAAQAQTYDFLDQNNIKARINANGNLFWDDQKKGFEVPAGSGSSTIYLSTFVLGAKNIWGTVYCASSDDFYPGPLLNGPATPSSDPYSWDRVWKISKAQIDEHRVHYADAGYTVPADIANWPANGNLLHGEPANVAPFVDANGNGTYEPALGDYPLIKGTQAIFFVRNDQKPGGSGDIPMGMEIQCMAYVFDCADDALQNTVFVNYRFINKSTMTYNDAYVGMFSDFDLGYFLDDYLGCSVSKGVVYAYNGDNYDEPSGINPNYQNSLPVQGVAFLGGPWQDSDGIDNPIIANYADATAANGIVYATQGKNFEDGIADNERMGMSRFIGYTGIGAPNPNMSDPDNGAQWYNYLSGHWRDGTGLSFGGTGYGDSTVLSDFAYFGDSDPLLLATRGISVPTNWREDLVGNIPGDRRGICSAGPFTIAPGETNELDIAYTTAIDNSGSGIPLQALPNLYARVNTVRGYFNHNLAPCGAFYSCVSETAEPSTISVYPNPVSQVLFVQNSIGKGMYTIQDTYGRVVENGNINGTRQSINVSAFAEGVYLFTINGNQPQKFVVQH